MNSIFARILPDGKRLHLQQGPIDLVIDADGEASEIALAFGQATQAFEPVLTDLVAELEVLRSPFMSRVRPSEPVAQIMTSAAANFAVHNVSPMIAVAGSVADYILGKMLAGRTLARVYVNNGGDISLYLNDGQSFDIGIVDRVDAPEISSTAHITSHDTVRGVATSGWRGRSFSLGVADAVTVLASTAALADAAATLIANEVDPGACAEVTRSPAHDLDPDSDLGARLVTTDVQPLSIQQRDMALQRGQELAQSFVRDGLISAAALSLQDSTCLAGTLDNKIAQQHPDQEKQYARG
jgi:uncharacterized protein